MRRSLRNRLLAGFVVLVVVVGGSTLFVIERTLANDLETVLDARLSRQGQAVARWMTTAGHPERLAPRLAAVTGARITVIGADGLVLGDSREPTTVGQPIGDAPEVAQARRGKVGRATRELRADQPPQYLLAIPADFGRVVRLAVPLDDLIATRRRMRNRLLAGAGFALAGALLLSFLFIRAITRPLQEMTQTAQRLAAGDYTVTAPIESGGELGVLAQSMNHMAGEVKARVDELTQQRDLLSVVFAGLVEGVVVVDRAGTIVLVNDAAVPLMRDRTRLPDELSALATSALAGAPADAELALNGRDVTASARPLREPDGAILVLYDVTRMRALEAVRREFLSNAAHELRTPVTSISGYAETLLGGAVDADTAKEFITTIHRNAQRISTLVSDLLVLDTLEGRSSAIAERSAIPLAEVVEDVVRTTKGANRDAEIAMAIDPALAVLATREGLDHAVQNLVDNAVKYGGGTPITIRAERTGQRVQLSVADAGSGIPAEHRDRVFERFYRIDPGRARVAGGSGLGLAIVKGQVEAMGGRVWVEDAAPGARFVVELDATRATPDADG